MAADGAIADGDEEGLVGHRRQAQHAIDRLAQLDALRDRDGCDAGAALRTSRRMRGGLPSSTSIGMSHRLVAEQRIAHHQLAVAVDLADDRERAALALRDGGESCASAPGSQRQHVALLRLVAPDLERRHAGLGARDRRAGRCARRAGCAPRPRAPRSRARRRRRRESARSDCASPSAQQRSMTSCARRCISALPRCTEAKSSSSLELPLPSEEAAPPPRPMSMAGPPSTMSGAPTGTSPFSTCARRMLPSAAGDHDRLVIAAHAAAADRPAARARRCGNSRRSPAGRTRC